MGVFVARAYAAGLHAGAGLQDLDWIDWTSAYDYQRTHRELAARIPGFQPVFTSDDYNVQCAACEAGIGAMILPVIRHRYARTSRLVQLDIDLGADALGTIFLVCHKRLQNLPKVQAVADRIKNVFVEVRREGSLRRSDAGSPGRARTKARLPSPGVA